MVQQRINQSTISIRNNTLSGIINTQQTNNIHHQQHPQHQEEEDIPRMTCGESGRSISGRTNNLGSVISRGRGAGTGAGARTKRRRGRERE